MCEMQKWPYTCHFYTFLPYKNTMHSRYFIKIQIDEFLMGKTTSKSQLKKVGFDVEGP